MNINSLNCCAPCFFGYDSFYTRPLLFRIVNASRSPKAEYAMVYFRPVCCCGLGMFGCPQVFRYVCDCMCVYIYIECVSAFSNHMVVCTYSVYVCFCKLLYLQCTYLMCACMHACNVKSCHVFQCFVMLCCFVLGCDVWFWVVCCPVPGCYVMFCFGVVCQVMSSNVMLCHDLLCQVCM